jgi:hypothetical protein
MQRCFAQLSPLRRRCARDRSLECAPVRQIGKILLEILSNLLLPNLSGIFCCFPGLFPSVARQAAVYVGCIKIIVCQLRRNLYSKKFPKLRVIFPSTVYFRKLHQIAACLRDSLASQKHARFCSIKQNFPKSQHTFAIVSRRNGTRYFLQLYQNVALAKRISAMP